MKWGWLKYGVMVILLAAFAAVFWWAYGLPGNHAAPAASISTQVGVKPPYSYVISRQAGSDRITAEFNPAIVNDDTTAIDVLREVMAKAYGGGGADDIQPVVEDIEERHYITFVSSGKTTVFELNKNEGGEVKSATFWRENDK
jgi:hypothetical protein